MKEVKEVVTRGVLCGAVRLRHCPTSRKVAGSIPGGVIEMFH